MLGGDHGSSKRFLSSIVTRRPLACKPQDGLARTRTRTHGPQVCEESDCKALSVSQGVGRITEFLRETAPGSETSLWEKQVKEVERNTCRDLRARRTPASTEASKPCIGISVMAESKARAVLHQFLYEPFQHASISRNWRDRPATACSRHSNH
ncbi:uncharacterized protein BJX67DRAFT_325584 [Aspergillus lucknowensis]|uniref:Uncharacterized protein n=1 Tax=Aspergillus lucknowensis TaxID=176173 RepID=A0ABR4L8P8_9EURO